MINVIIERCSIEKLVRKFHHMETSVVELFTKSEDPYRKPSLKMLFYRAFLLSMYRMTHR